MKRSPRGRRRRVPLETFVLPTGLGVQGPGFYVFEEDFGQALGWSSELARVDVAALAPPFLAPNATPSDTNQ